MLLYQWMMMRCLVQHLCSVSGHSHLVSALLHLIQSSRGIQHFHLDLLRLFAYLPEDVAVLDLKLFEKTSVLLSRACDNWWDHWCVQDVRAVLVLSFRLRSPWCTQDMSI